MKKPILIVTSALLHKLYPKLFKTSRKTSCLYTSNPRAAPPRLTLGLSLTALRMPGRQRLISRLYAFSAAISGNQRSSAVHLVRVLAVEGHLHLTLEGVVHPVGHLACEGEGWG